MGTKSDVVDFNMVFLLNLEVSVFASESSKTFENPSRCIAEYELLQVAEDVERARFWATASS